MRKSSLLPLLALTASLTATGQSSLLADENFIGASDALRATERPLTAPQTECERAWTDVCARAGISHADGAEAAREYLSLYPGALNRPQALMLLGDCLLEADPAAALAAFDSIDPSALAPDARRHLAYHRAYALVALGQLDAAEPLLRQAYADKALRPGAAFFMGYIAYCRHQYDEAKRYLAQADRSCLPGNMADFYLAQILYVEDNYPAALTAAKALLAAQLPASDEYRAEAARIAGESLFQMGDADKAIPYLRQYAATASAPARSALYILGTAEFNDGQYQQAISTLERVVNSDEDPDATTQSAYLFIGQALREQQDRAAALLAFEKAFKLDFDQDVAEAAFYNYAVARSEGARVPFGSSAEVFEEFLRRFPAGTHAPAVQEYLVAGYLTDSDYEGALASINRMAAPTEKVLRAKQQVLYALGTRALSSDDARTAVDLLTQARAISPSDSATDARAALSLGQALYRLGDNSGAARAINEYLAGAPADDPNRVLARYDLGYALLALKDYEGASAQFAPVAAKNSGMATEVKADALNRLADTYYYRRLFPEAITQYIKAYETMPSAGDYPLFQQGVIEGYQNKPALKISTLARLVDEFPTSSLVPDALLETTEAYIRLGDNKSAISTYKRLVDQYPSTEQGRRGYLQMALTRLNAGDRSGAISDYKDVVRLYPTSEEARMAVDELKRLSAEDGTLPKIAAWLASVENAPRLDPEEAERLTFEAAEKIWITESSTARLEDYLMRYPDGASRPRALAYMMEAADLGGNTADVLAFASEICSRYPDSRQAEQALLAKADAEYALGRASEALQSYSTLEKKASSPQSLNAARLGQMRAARDLADNQRVIAAADALLASSTAGAEYRDEAIFSRANALDLSGKTAEARSLWASLADNTDDLYGAKSAFYLAQSYFDASDLSQARSRVQALIDSATPHSYWLARGFILLSDIFAAEGRNFEAREYLNSLKENYPGSETDIFQMIDTRLASLK